MTARPIARRLASELGASLLVWGLLWIPGVYNAVTVGRTRGVPAHPDIEWFIGVRYVIYALLSIALFELSTAVPFRKGARIRAAAAHAVGLPLFVVCYAVLRTMALRWVHGVAEPFSQVFRYQLEGQLSTLLFEQLWAYGAVVLLAHAVVHHRAAREREMGEAELRAELARRHLQILRLQLRPHFLFNALHGISSLIDSDPERARTAISQFSDLLRTALRRTTVDEVSLREEIAFIESYLALERLRIGDRLDVTIEAPDALRDAIVPSMVLQPLVENAIRHGIEQRREGGRVELGIQAAAGRLELRVVNDAGRGLMPGTGIGLQNTRGRLRALYGAEHELVTTSTPDHRFQVVVTIPLRFGGPAQVAS